MKSASRLLAVVVLMFGVCSRVDAQGSRKTADEKSGLATRTAGLQRRDGFLPYYWDEKKGDILFELSPAALGREFLYFTGLGSGIGSPEAFADRSSFGGGWVCRFRRAGMRVLVIQQNTSFRAPKGAPELQHSVESSFPSSVLASLPVEAEQDGTVLVDAEALFLRDAFDLLSQLRRPTRAVGGVMVREQSSRAADWRLDKDRSIIDLEHSGSFPLNTEVEALLTFATDSESDLNQPDPHTLSVREHHSFVAISSPGYEPLEQDPRVGFISLSFQDFSQAYDRPLTRYLVERWRLQKKDPSAALSEPVQPIVFFLDRAIPEPVRSAARTGALWWNTAFEQAGFKNALRIEDLPQGADPMDIRYPTIQWTNRSGRGWSVGQSHVDPRTGEIIHAVVQLDSHRMRTVNNYWESASPSGRDPFEPALDSFAALDNLDPQTSEQQVLLNRLALLTCHEMGHVLGLDHNFVASTYGRGSVMDYFAPLVRIRADGTADLSDAYMQGVGSYDRHAIEWGYSQGKPGSTAEQEQARLDTVVKGAIAKGIVWGNTEDPRWNSYDDGPDPVTWLKQVLPVRDALLAHYGPRMLRPGEPNSHLASRLPLVYLFHRYALGAAINVVGSAKVPLSLAGDGQPPVSTWPAESQKEALRLAVQALSPAKLNIPAELWRGLAPVENRDSDPERFASSAGYLFSPQDGARAVAEIVVGGLLNPQRVQRLAVISRQDAHAISPGYLVSALVTTAFSDAAKTPAELDLAGVVQTELAERLMVLAVNPEATPEVRAVALAGVREVQSAVKSKAARGPVVEQLAQEIALFLQNPGQNTPKLKSSGAPAGPPV
ncbi:MAG TPA: zinc-dependent metalloprotease [Terriglobales bacterium]|nr:zinc-dependent metalloprotease [Terriglobales bacterium]